VAHPVVDDRAIDVVIKADIHGGRRWPCQSTQAILGASFGLTPQHHQPRIPQLARHTSADKAK
jgi:hypothetical protein